MERSISIGCCDIQMSKKKSVSTLKKKLWKLTSEYVRRSAIQGDGTVSCVTCGHKGEWRRLQAGHFIPKSLGTSIYFDLRNIHPQCYRCNINLGSNGPEYFRFMQERYGDEVIEDLRALSRTTLKLYASDYEEMIEEMKEKLKCLDSQ